jgi:signal transduction histidine kinase
MEEELLALPIDVKEFFYRIAQETLNNITKHSKASHINVHLDQTDTGVLLCIQDDGKGFDPKATQPGHLGLEIMRERAAAINASLNIDSRPGRGTVISSEWRRSG